MGFYIQDDYWEAIEDLPAKQQDEVMGSLVRLFFTGENTTPLKGASKTAVAMARERVLLARKRSLAGSSKANQNSNQTTHQNDEQNDNQNGSEDASKTESNSDFAIKEGEGEVDRGYLTHTPTRDDVRDFAVAEKLTLDVDKFFDHYEANGWRMGANPVADWQAAARKAANDWAKSDRPTKPTGRPRCPECGSTRQISKDHQTGIWQCLDCHAEFKEPDYVHS